MSANAWESGLPECTCPAAEHCHGTAAMYEIHGCGCVPCTAAHNVQFRQRRDAAAGIPSCDCPRARHEHGTRIMYNRHRCHCTPCRDANRDYTQALRRHRRSLPACGCKKASVAHEHGTRGMYAVHDCRCAPCTAANTEYSRNYTRPERIGIAPVEMADADQARDRIAVLRAAGMTVADIAAACGLNRGALDFVVYGRNGKPPARIRETTVAALQAITYKDALAVDLKAGRKVDPDVPRRQVQSLYSLGWRATDIAACAGVKPTSITSLLRGNGCIEKVRAGIETAYTQMRGTLPPETTPSEKAQAARARNEAVANGWTVDTAEDHLYAAYARAA